jgi:WD40 repeat protein
MRFQLRTRIPQPGSTTALAASRDGRFVATTNFDQKLRVYDGRTLALLKALHLGTSFPHAVCFSPDGSLVGSGGKAITLFDTATWKKLRSLKGHRHELQNATFSPDGARVFTGSGNNYTPADWSVRAWDQVTGAELWRWKARTSVFAVAASPDGTLVAAGDTGGRVALLDAATGAARWYVDVASWIYRLRFTPSGDAIVASGDADVLAVIDPATGAHRDLPLGNGARAFALTRDGATAIVGRTAYGDPCNLVAIDLATGDTRWQSEALGRLPQGLELSPDDDVIYVLMNDPHELIVLDRVG